MLACLAVVIPLVHIQHARLQHASNFINVNQHRRLNSFVIVETINAEFNV